MVRLVSAIFIVSTVFNVYALSDADISVSIASPGTTVPQYTKLELLVTLQNAQITKFYDPDPSVGGLDLSATFTPLNGNAVTVNGFFDGSSWRVRFAPTVVGDWNFTVRAIDIQGTATFSGGAFTCTQSSLPGFAAIDGAYLKFNDSISRLAIGHNTGWQYNVEQPALSDMVAQGENLLSFWMCAPWIIPSDNISRTPIENSVDGLGNYNQATCAYLDGVISRADAAGIYLLPSIWAHDQLSDSMSGWPSSWANNPYKTLCTAAAFYTTKNGSADTPQWSYQQKFYRYLLARWGYSRAIVGWVGVVEIDGTNGWGANNAECLKWITALKTYFATNDTYRVSSAAKYPLMISRLNTASFDPGLDVRCNDSYSSSTSNTNVAQTLANDTRTMRNNGKPGAHTEFGGDVNSGATQPTHLHNGVWGGLSAGAAMTPLLWCDAGSYPMLTPAMRDQLRFAADFMSRTDFAASNSLTYATVSVPSGLRGWGMKLSDRGFAWIQNTLGSTLNAQSISISGVLNGTYNVSFYDVWTNGAIPFNVKTASVSAGTLTFTLPALSRADMALKFYMTSAAPAVAGVSANPPIVDGNSTLLSVSASDDGGESTLAYHWSLDSGPAAVVFSANDSNAAKNATATFSKAGAYSLRVTIYDAGGLSSSAVVSVTVNQTVLSLAVSPTSAAVSLNGLQQFTCSGTDQFGNAIANPSVVWSIDAGQTISASGVFSANGVAGGPYTVTAQTATVSGTATVTVVNYPPAVTITNPTNNVVFTLGSPITIAASASDPDGSVASVEFFDGSTSLGVVTTAPYTFVLNNASVGTHVLSARATDSSGATGTSANVTIIVNNPPTVSITSPANGSSVKLSRNGTSITIAANASDSDGTVSKVEFYVNGALAGSDSSSPYSVSYKITTAGNYTLTAKAYDNRGAITTSQPGTITAK